MKDELEIGEKVLMFSLKYNENGKLDLLKTFVEKVPKEVIVKKHDNLLSHDIITVIDDKHDEYCGVHFRHDNYGKVGLLRREEYITVLHNIEERVYINGYVWTGIWTSNEVQTIKAIKHQLNSVCNHLFVVQKEGSWVPGFHSSDYEYDHSIITCVHCGLTNRYCGLHNLRTYFTIDNDAFYDYLNMSYPENVRYARGDESFIPLLSKEVYFFDNPRSLYSKAKKINPEATNEEIYQLMKEIELKEHEENRRSWQEREGREKKQNRQYKKSKKDNY